MKVCPHCNAKYEDSLFFCTEDGFPLRSPADANLEQTLVLPATQENTAALPTRGENTLNLTYRPEETSALTGENHILPESVPTAERPPATTSLTPAIPVETAENLEKPRVTSVMDSPGSGPSGRGKLIVLGLIFGALVLTVSGLVGWWALRPRPTDIGTNINKENANLNVNSERPINQEINNNNSVILVEGNSNLSDANLTPSPTIDTEKPTPSPTSTTEKSPTPTPKDSPSITPSVTPPVTPPPTPPPTPKTPTPTPDERPVATIDGGVLNTHAEILYQPKYPAAAKEAGIGGKVNVQVLVDENGRVVSVNAVSGHPSLRATSEQAARSCKFRPMTSGGARVKVRGVLVFTFVP